MWNGVAIKSGTELGYQISEQHSLRIAGRGLVVTGPYGEVRVPVTSNGSAAIASALSRLQPAEPVPESQFLESVRAAGGDGIEQPGILQHLARLGALQRVVTADKRPLAVVEPISDFYELKEAREPLPDTPIRLSRFSYLRSDDGAVVLESPLCHARVRLVDPRLAGLLTRLSQPHSVLELLRNDPGALDEYVRPAAALFMAEGFVAPVTTVGEAEVDDTRTLRQWEFHDLLFHTRTRFGRHRYPVGGNFRFLGKLPPLPAVKPPMSAVRLPLPRPDLTSVALQDMPLTTVVEYRASVRSYGPSPVTLAQLGEFLYRVARVRQRTLVAGVELTNRPYPNGGASYELELYPIVDRCQGLLPGFYHYDPGEHTLEPLTSQNTVTEQFLQDAWGFSGQEGRPEILVMIAARFGRVSWKYSSIAYATILKNVGALLQTMYLVATAMRLAPCALGCGDSDRFSRLLGEDYYAETAVGEFMLGSLPTNHGFIQG
jgi:oxazoline/thiazoline dehydrogenase